MNTFYVQYCIGHFSVYTTEKKNDSFLLLRKKAVFYISNFKLIIGSLETESRRKTQHKKIDAKDFRTFWTHSLTDKGRASTNNDGRNVVSRSAGGFQHPAGFDSPISDLRQQAHGRKGSRGKRRAEEGSNERSRSPRKTQGPERPPQGLRPCTRKAPDTENQGEPTDDEGRRRREHPEGRS